MSMFKAEVSSSSQTAHYNHRLRESLTSTSAAQWHMAALTGTLFSHFRYTAVFTIAHHFSQLSANVILRD
jgi:hypothetical protein